MVGNIDPVTALITRIMRSLVDFVHAGCFQQQARSSREGRGRDDLAGEGCARPPCRHQHCFSLSGHDEQIPVLQMNKFK